MSHVRSVPEKRLRRAAHAKSIATAARAVSASAGYLGGRAAVVHKEVGVHADIIGAADAMALQPGAIDERAGRRGTPSGNRRAPGSGF
jgi:hypothetical protein